MFSILLKSTYQWLGYLPVDRIITGKRATTSRTRTRTAGRKGRNASRKEGGAELIEREGFVPSSHASTDLPLPEDGCENNGVAGPRLPSGKRGHSVSSFWLIVRSEELVIGSVVFAHAKGP
ncbi:uncharacterized protein LOC143219341 [Lasioglossum baleicum]|uniref:uncharacterized protein LOC143219341 n=1 Tax=Lasioglossum baleicum TaxID=434251 RepID=UPI003FCD1441